MPIETPTWDESRDEAPNWDNSTEETPTWENSSLEPDDFLISPQRQVPNIAAVTGGGPRVSVPSFAESAASFSDFPSEMWQNLNTPTFQIPHMEVPKRPLGDTPESFKAGAGVVNSLSDTASFFTSPLGVATLGIGALPRTAQRVIAGAFAAHMASQFPDVATEFWSEIKKPASERSTEKLFNLGTTTATQLGFITAAGKHAFTPTPKALRLAEEIDATEFTPGITPDEAAAVNLGLPTRFQPPVLPELSRTGELVDRAIQEAQQKIVVPGQVSAIDLLKAQGNEIVPETTATAERVQGGGEAPYGKVSYQRTLESPKTPSSEPRTATATEQPTNIPVSVGPNAPPPPVVANPLTISEKLSALKFKADKDGGVLPDIPGQTFSLPHSDAVKLIGKQLWNDSVDVAIKLVNAGKSVAEAVDAAIEHIRKNAIFDVKSKFDEAKTRESLMASLEDSPESSKPAVPRVEGEELRMRKSAERAINSDQFPEPVRETITESPRSQYKVQPEADVRDVVSAMSDAELAAVTPESNIYVASKGMLSKRLFDQGKFDEGFDVFMRSSEQGTGFGQNINQFKWIKGVTPFDVVKVVNQGLTKSGRDPLTKPQEQKVANAANESIDANSKLEKAKNDWVNNPTDTNAKLADAAAAETHRLDIETQKLVNQYTPKSWPKMLKAFVQGNPLTPISQVANVVGNVLGAGMEVGSRGVGSMVDQVRTMFTSGDRKLATSPIAGPASAARGVARGAKQGVEILKRGSGDVVKGEVRQNLRPLRALQTAFAKNPDVPTIGGKVPFNERVRLVVEGTFGISPEVMLRLLSAADRPSYEAARARLINEQSKLKGVPSEYRTMAQKFPEMFFDRDTQRLILDESSNAVFQNKSPAISYLESLIKNNGGDWADLGFTMLVAPYRLTPWNLVGRTLIYNPLIAAARTAHFASKGNARQAELNSGRMIVGGMLYGAGYFLYKNGLIGPSLDSRDETKKERLLAGEVIPPNHVNISGLKRLANGGDPKFRPGDETIDLTRGGGAAGAILSSVANIGRDFEKKPEGSSPFLASLLKNSTLEQASFTVNQSFLKGVTGILDAIRDRNLEPYMNSVESMFLNLGTPNTLSTLSRATRKYAPDLKDPSEIKSFQNLAKERFGIAGLDDYFPLKRDLWGKPMLQTPEGRNAILYHLFDISKNKQVTSDPVALEIYDLWRQTASRSVIPSIPDREITVARKTVPLNSKQYERLVELTGQIRRQIMDPLVINPEFQNLSPEDKIRVIEQAYRNGAEAGKALFVEETPPNQLKEANKPKAGFKP